MTYQGAIFDVDGVLVDSPHELAWREALKELLEGDWRDISDRTSWTAERFTTQLYQQVIAGKPRLAGARAALEHFGVPDVDRRAEQYAAIKQEQVLQLIEQGRFRAFPDALRFILAVKNTGIRVAAASSSKNAKLLLQRIRLDTFTAEQRLDYGFVHSEMTLAELFDADISGRDFSRGKPDPMIFLAAAEELGLSSEVCFVIEDATSGVQAAKAGGFTAIGVARLGDEQQLADTGADLVVTTLDDVALPALFEGRFEERQAAEEIRRRYTEQPPNVWTLVYEGFDPARQGLREALCALGNGYFVTRGAFPEAKADDVNYPGTYVAGLYNRLTSEIAGRQVENEDLVNLPNWLPLEFRIAGGPWFDMQQPGVHDHHLELDMKHATLIRRFTWQDPRGRRTKIVQRRFVSREDEHLAGLQTEFTAENWSDSIQVRSGLDGRIVNAGVKRYRDLNGQHLTTLNQTEVEKETIDLQVETNQSHVRVALAARSKVLREGEIVEVDRSLVSEPGFIAQDVTFELRQGQPVTVEKIVALYTSRDPGISESGQDARLAVARAADFAELLSGHQRAWQRAWNRCDIEMDSANEWTATVLHLHIFHLLQTVSPRRAHLDVGVPARGWHGEAYRGHIFWDELFIFPYINFQRPWLAAALLDYRYARLGAARAAAGDEGFAGAMFPWQSGSNGREETQRLHLNPISGRWLPDRSHRQRHVNIAIAYNVWQHYMVTGSLEFLRFTGVELLIEIARFWSSITTHNPTADRYEINGVMGPDEYHDGYPNSDEEGLRNNTYTNVMAVWVLQRALEALQELPPHYRQELAEELSIHDEELERWGDISRKMTVVFHADGVLSQFEGYEQLLEFDWEGYRDKYGNIQRLDRVLEAEGDSTNRYKVSKQADVLMLLYLLPQHELRDLLADLGHKVSDEQLARTVDYYLARTSHGSTLSSVVTAWVLARYAPDKAWRFLQQALQSDVADVQGGTTAEGIHLGAMAGTVDLVLRCLTGMRGRGQVLQMDPAMPPQIRQLRFSVHYRGHRIELVLSEDHLELSSRPGPATPITVVVHHQTVSCTRARGIPSHWAQAGRSPVTTLSEHAARVAGQAQTAAMCLDFDGSLAPIVDDPDKATPLQGTAELLGHLATRFAVVALISGRPADYLAKHAAAPGVRYLGLYGLQEIRDGEVWVDPRVEAARPAVIAALQDLRNNHAVRDSGAYLEDKRYAVAVHTRRVADPASWTAAIDNAARQVADLHRLEVVPGKLVWELRPAVRSDKGDAVRRVIGESNARNVIVAGDDLGDVPAFAAALELKARGGDALCVAVDSAEAPAALLDQADLVVDGPSGLLAFLRQLLAPYQSP